MGWMLPAAMLGSSLLNSGAQSSAASTQSAAQQQAAQTQMNMFNTINGQQQPYIQSGYNAQQTLNQLMGLPLTSAPQTTQQNAATGATGTTGATTNSPTSQQMQQLMFGSPDNGQGLSQTSQPTTQPTTSTTSTPGTSYGTPGNTGLPNGYLTQTFNPTSTQLDQYPGYQYALNTGGQAVKNADTPTQGALSGATIKDLMNFDQGMASQNYGNYFNQFQTQQNNIFDRLNTIAGIGQNAAANVGNAGTKLGTGVAEAQAASGASQAGGITGSTSALTSNSLPLAYLMSGNTSANLNNSINAGANANAALTAVGS